MYTLIDAEERNKKYPETFHIPSREDIVKVEKGIFVKLIFSEGKNFERMWVRVTHKIGNDFKGVLSSKPSKLISIKDGELVLFKSNNIVEIFE